jgi:hypothetical protein
MQRYAWYPGVQGLKPAATYDIKTRDSDSHCRESFCQHKFSTCATLFPGLFIVMCLHGICLGYNSMRDLLLMPICSLQFSPDAK